MDSKANILAEILAVARESLLKDGEMGYTMPDGKYHIYIYADQEDRWDDQPGEKFYVVEPNRVVNGAHEPMGDTYITSFRDLSEVLIGCQWCMDWFENDQKTASRGEDLPDELIVRLAHEAGWLEAEGKIEVHSWEDIQVAIRDAIQEYYDAPGNRNPFDIEEVISRILSERFPSEPTPEQPVFKEVHVLTRTLESTYGIECEVTLHPSAEEALKHAQKSREEEDFDEARCNFDIAQTVLDVSSFKTVPLEKAVQMGLFKPEPASQTPVKKSLNEKIQSAGNKQSHQTPGLIISQKDWTL